MILVHNLKTAEKIWLFIVLFAGLTAAAAISLLSNHFGFIHSLATVAGTQVSIGREGAMFAGSFGNASVGILIMSSFIVDTLGIMIGLPIYLLFYPQLRVIPPFSWILAKFEKIKVNRHSSIYKFGLVGLFIFCFIPFQLTGALASTIVGKLLGYNTRVVLMVVLPAALFASIFWAVTANFIISMMAHVIESPLVIAGIIAAVIASAYLIVRIKGRGPGQ